MLMFPLVCFAAAAVAAAANSTRSRVALDLHKVNILVTTDVHSWVHGHRHPDTTPPADADAGDLVSFYAHVREAADQQNRDVFLFDNGDVNDGTGFDKGSIAEGLLPLLAQLPYSALTTGNHELYEGRDIRALLDSGFVSGWGGRYLTSNVRLVSSGKHLGAPFVAVEGKHGTKLLVFGFLYDMPDADAEVVSVESPAMTVEQEWFADALLTHGAAADAIVVLGHMSAGDALVGTIVAAIRSRLPATPVQFLAGHSHRLTWRKVDDHSAVLEAGSNLKQLGFASFDTHSRQRSTWFHYQFIDWNLAALYELTGRDAKNWDTAAGVALRNDVRAAQQRLGLLDVVGCQNEAPKLSRSAAVDASASLWGLYLKHTIPEGLFSPPRNASQWFLSGTGSLRYDLYNGEVLVDDIYTMAPFQNGLRVIQGIPGEALLGALERLQTLRTFRGVAIERWDHAPRWESEALPRWVHTEPLPVAKQTYDVFMVSFDEPQVVAAVAEELQRPVSAKVVRPELNEGRGLNDTGLWIEWAKAGGLPAPPCKELPASSCAHCGCSGQCGACWCNDKCSQYGNCCSDYTAVCSRR